MPMTNNKKQADSVFHAFYPPRPLPKGLYLCDKGFHLETLLENKLVLPSEVERKIQFSNSKSKVDEKKSDVQQQVETVCVAVVEGEATTLYDVCGTLVTKVDHVQVHRQKRQKKGGQSAHRFQMIRLGQMAEYVRLAADRIQARMVKQQNVVAPLLLLGSTTKDMVRSVSDTLAERKIAHTVAASNLDLHTKATIVDQAKVVLLATQEKSDESLLADAFDHKNDALLVYGKKEVSEACRLGQLRRLLVVRGVVSEEDLLSASSQGCQVCWIRDASKHAMFAAFGQAVGLQWHTPAPTNVVDAHQEDHHEASNTKEDEKVGEEKSLL